MTEIASTCPLVAEFKCHGICPKKVVIYLRSPGPRKLYKGKCALTLLPMFYTDLLKKAESVADLKFSVQGF